MKKENIYMDSFLLTVFVFGGGLFSIHTIVWPVLHVSVWGHGGDSIKQSQPLFSYTV